MKAGSAAVIRTNVDLSTVVRDDPFAQCQPDACPFEVLPLIESLEDQKNTLGEPWIDPDALVGEDDLAVDQLSLERRMFFDLVRGQYPRRDVDDRRQAGF